MRRRSRGQAMVEFALVAPMFMALFVGLADVARGLLAYNELAQGSRAAAREAVLQYNDSSNSTSGCSSPCLAPGVVPIIKQEAGFGFSVNYADSSTSTSLPSYGACAPLPVNQTTCANSSYAANGNQLPISIALASSASSNAIYVFVYQYNPGSSSSGLSATQWNTRSSGHEYVVVDLKLRWTSITLSLLGLSPAITLDGQTVERAEF